MKKRPEPAGDSEGTADLLPSEETDPEDTLIDREQKQRVHEALGHLNERERSAMVMKYTEGMSYAEIAEVIGTSVPAVESLLSRAKGKMRKSLGKAASEGSQ